MLDTEQSTQCTVYWTLYSTVYSEIESKQEGGGDAQSLALQCKLNLDMSRVAFVHCS